MGLFDRMYYGKAGKRDYSERDMPKTRVSLFFMVLKDHIFDLIKVNFLQLIFWVPFIFWTYLNIAAIQNVDAEALLALENGSSELMGTLSTYLFMWLIGVVPCVLITGPSSAGAAYIMRNWARDQHAFLFSDFVDAVKENWKAALGISAITAIVPLSVYTGMNYYGALASQNLIMMLPMVIALSVTVLWTLMLPLTYPMLIGYQLRFKDVVRNSFLMAFARLPLMVLARVITFLPLLGFFLALYYGSAIGLMIASLYYMLFGFALSRLVYASIANSIFDRYMNPHIEGAGVRMGLRPEDPDEQFDDDEDDEEDNEEVDEDE